MLSRKLMCQRGGIEVLRLKSCPRCKTGDVGVDRDQHGWYEYCIQCGYVRDLIGVVELGQAASRKKARRKAKAPGKGE
jgi:hypothetical protein